MDLETQIADARHYAEYCDFMMDLYPEDEYRKEDAALAWKAYNDLFEEE